MTSIEEIQSSIYLIRGHKVMFDRDLSKLYGVEVKVLIQAVKRNRDRFPEDFMFQLDWAETANSRSQIVTLKRGQNIKYRPYVFTEQGVAMLSGVLKSKRAVQVNIAIMRVFVHLRKILVSHRDLAEKLAELERKLAKHDHEIRSVFEAIRGLMSPPAVPKRRIGFHR